MNINWTEIINTIIYAGIGVILMLVSMYLFDLTVHYDFNKELKEKNVAAGFVIAGIFIAIGIIIRTVII
ncbi:MAG: DUF350 domain-containing protein [Clostridia bacterium]|nr:DUF350 domain-containing protein [Clostridia bacterium]